MNIYKHQQNYIIGFHQFNIYNNKYNASRKIKKKINQYSDLIYNDVHKQKSAKNKWQQIYEMGGGADENISVYLNRRYHGSNRF